MSESLSLTGLSQAVVLGWGVGKCSLLSSMKEQGGGEHQHQGSLLNRPHLNHLLGFRGGFMSGQIILA